jgi:hypothetical protein
MREETDREDLFKGDLFKGDLFKGDLFTGDRKYTAEGKDPARKRYTRRKADFERKLNYMAEKTMSKMDRELSIFEKRSDIKPSPLTISERVRVKNDIIKAYRIAYELFGHKDKSNSIVVSRRY